MNKYMKASFNSGFIGYALAQYEEEQLINLQLDGKVSRV